MAKGMLLTNDGKKILRKGLIGKEIKFSKVAYGAGDFDYQTENVADLTALRDWKMDLPIVGKEIQGGAVLILAQLNNFTLQAGFAAKEIGVFAIDPDTEKEVLYAYRNAGQEYNFIPANTGVVVKNTTMGYWVEIGDAENITCEINFAFAYVSQEDFKKHLQSYHPQLLDEIETTEKIWASDEDENLHPLSIENLKNILGESSIATSTSNTNEEKNFEEVGLSFETFVQKFIDSEKNVSRETDFEKLSEFVEMKSEIGLAEPNIFLIENFNPQTLIDETKIKISSCAKGGNILSAETLDGVKIGGEYFLSDGVSCEQVKISNIQISAAAILINNSNFLLTLENNLQNSYNLDETFLLKSNVTSKKIFDSENESSEIVSRETFLAGNLPIQFRKCKGRETFAGCPANVPRLINLDFSCDNFAAYSLFSNAVCISKYFTM